MLGIPAEQIVPIANFIGLGILGVVAYFGQRWGRGQAVPADKTLEVAGALIDAKSVQLLAAAIEAGNFEVLETRKAHKEDAEKARALGHRLVDALNSIADELQELRREVAQLGREIARKG